MLNIKGLRVTREGTRILDGVDLKVKKGQSIALQGASGCGKSTLLKALVGGCRWQADHFIVNDQPMAAADIHSVRQNTGYIGQESPMSGTSIRETLERPFQFAAYKGREFPRPELARLMQQFHLSDELLERHPSSLSGGQRQRFAIIRILLLKPRLIIADEPTSALDTDSRDSVIRELLHSGKTIISTSHDQYWLDQCDSILIMEKGRIMGEKHVQCY